MRLIAATTVLIFLAACSPPQQTVTIEFEARLGDQPIDCETVVDGLTMTDLRFYVDSPALLDPIGAATLRFQDIQLAEQDRWQHGDLALIDLENGKGACRNGTPETNALLIGTVPEGEYKGISFTVGVPFELNHADPLEAAPPLDDSTMHWHWRSGYKFLRAGFETPNDGFWMHVGSAGCDGTVGNITGCRHENRIMVMMFDYQPGDRIVFDFQPLIDAVDLEDETPTDCSSGPSEDTCMEPFRRLKLNFEDGQAGGNAEPFRVLAQ